MTKPFDRLRAPRPFGARGARRGLALVLAAGLLLVSACNANPGQSSNTQTTAATKGGDLTILTSQTTINFDPAKSQSLAITSLGLVLRRLTSWQTSPTETTKPIPDLATDTGRSSDNGKTWTYTLKDGLKYDDGTAITSQDIKYGVERSFAAQLSGGLSYHKALLVGGSDYRGPYDGKQLSSIETPDNKTIIFHLNAPYADWPWIVSMGAFAPVPKAKDTNPATYGNDPAASGPYKIDSLQQGVSLVMSRNPNWDQATDPARTAGPNTITFKMSQDETVQAQALISDSGSAQTSFGADFVPAAQLAQAAGNPQVGNRLVTSGDGALNFLSLNTQRGNLKNKEIRQALNYAIDRNAFITASGGTKTGDPATTLITPGIEGRQAYDLYPAGTSGNVTKAKQLLSDAGHADDLSFTLVTSNQPIALAQAQAIQQAYAKVNVKITLRPLDANAVADLVTQGNGDYDMYLGSWQPDFPSANGNIQPLFDSSQIGGGGYNTSRYDNAKWIVDQAGHRGRHPGRRRGVVGPGRQDDHGRRPGGAAELRQELLPARIEGAELLHRRVPGVSELSEGEPEPVSEQASPPSPAAATAETALAVRDLRIAFRGADLGRGRRSEPTEIVHGIDFDLYRGRVLALVGESGSGKSVTAMSLLGLLPPSASVSGRVTLGDEELLGASAERLRSVRGQAIATIFQEPAGALNPVFTIGHQLEEAIWAHHPELGAATRRRRAFELLESVQVQNPARIAAAYPHETSGGQLQRAMIAMAISNDPEIIIADEPTTALDVTVQAGILELLRDLKDRLGTAVLLITHDMGVVADLADDVAVMRQGSIIERAPSSELFAHPKEDYTRELLAAVPELDAATARDAGPDGSDGDRPKAAAELVDADVVFGRGPEAVHAVDHVSLRIEPGEFVGLVGESGSGKSTVGRTLSGLVPLGSGYAELAGVDLSRARGSALRRVRSRLGLVFQDPASSLNPRHTIGRSIADPLRLHTELDQNGRRARVDELLDAVRLDRSLAERLPHELSGGQRQRVAIARALSTEPELLIADEPTSALDVSVQEQILVLLRKLQSELGFACLFISHDLAVVSELTSRVIVMQDGRIVEQGPTRQVLQHPAEPYTQRLLAAVPVADPRAQAERRAAWLELETSVG